MINRYWSGQDSGSFLGNSYLFTNPTVTVEEGYKVGSSTHIVRFSNYEVDSFGYGSLSEETVDLTISSPISRPSKITPLINHSIYSPITFYDDFSLGDFNQRYTSSGSGINFRGACNSSSLVSQVSFAVSSDSTAVDNKVFINNSSVVRDADITVKFQSDDLSGSYGGTMNCNIFMRCVDENSGYKALWSKSESLVKLMAFGSWGETTLASQSAGLSISQGFRLRVKVENENIKVYGSTNNTNFNNLIDYPSTFGVSYPYYHGLWGFGSDSLTTDSGEILVREIYISELKRPLTQEDLIHDIYNLSGVYGISVQNRLNPFSGVTNSSGSSWIYSEPVTVSRVSTGQTWDFLFDPNQQNQNVLLSCDIWGSSGTQAGLMVGEGLQGTSASRQYIIGYAGFGGVTRGFGVELLGQTRASYTNMSSSLNLLPNQWYNFKLVTRGSLVVFLVNNKTMAVIPKHSTLDISTPQYGVVASNSSGNTVSFRNPRISILDYVIETVELNRNSSLDSSLSRVLSNEFYFNYSGDAINVFEVGASRGTWNFENLSHLRNLQQTVSNVQYDYFSLTGNVYELSLSNDKFRSLKQVDKSNFSFRNVGMIDNSSDISKFSDSLYDYTGLEEDEVSYSTTFNPKLENGDRIVIGKGIPNNGSKDGGDNDRASVYIVTNQSKEISSSGEATHKIKANRINE